MKGGGKVKSPFKKLNSNQKNDQDFEKTNFAQRIGRFFSPEPQKEKVCSRSGRKCDNFFRLSSGPGQSRSSLYTCWMNE